MLSVCCQCVVRNLFGKGIVEFLKHNLSLLAGYCIICIIYLQHIHRNSIVLPCIYFLCMIMLLKLQQNIIYVTPVFLFMQELNKRVIEK